MLLHIDVNKKSNQTEYSAEYHNYYCSMVYGIVALLWLTCLLPLLPVHFMRSTSEEARLEVRNRLLADW